MGFTSPYIMLLVIEVSLSEHHTSEKDGTSIAFTKVCMEWYEYHAFLKVYVLKIGLKKVTYKCFQMYIHHANIYPSSLLTFHIRLVHVFIK